MGEKTEIEKIIDRVDQNRKEINALENRIIMLEEKNKTADSEIQDLKKYKEVVIELKKDIKIIIDKLADLKGLADAKARTTLTIAIAILSPLFTALIAFLMWWWFYKPVNQQNIQQVTPKTSMTYIYNLS